MSSVKRNGNIEILRFVFSILIIFHHFNASVFEKEFFTACYLGVEFFFIVTGIFLGRKLKAEKEKHHAESFGTAAKESTEYVWKRICGIYPYFFLATIIGFAARSYISVSTLSVKEIAGLCGDLSFAQMLDLPIVSTTGTLWYLCALFFALLLIYPFARKFFDAYVYHFSMLFPPFIVGLLTASTTSIGGIVDKLFGVVNAGLLRAVAMISIGFVVNELADRLKKLPVNNLNRIVFTVAELVLYTFLFVCLIFIRRSKVDYLFLILMAVSLIITLSEKSLLYGEFDNRFSLFLGKTSMIIFMCHYSWVYYIDSYVKRLPTVLQKGKITDIALGLLLTAATSVIVYFGGNLLRFLFRKVKTALFAPPKPQPEQG